MPRGGRRPGSGRPSNASREEKAQLQARQTAKFNEAALTDLMEYYETAKQLALGIWREDVDEEGKPIKVYQEKPVQGVLMSLLEHAKGKSTTAQIATTDTEIKVIHQIPRAPRAKPGTAASIEEADGST